MRLFAALPDEAQVLVLLPVPVGRKLGQGAKACLALAQRALRLFLLRDVAPGPEDARLPIDLDARARDQRIELASIGAHQANFVVRYPAFLGDARDERCALRRITKQARGIGRAQRRLLAAMAGNPIPCAVRRETHFVAQPQQADRLGAILEERRKLALCFMPLALDAALLGDIDQRNHEVRLALELD